MKYTDAALEAAAKLAARHLRDYKLPDSAIDMMDEAGAVTKLKHRAAEPRGRDVCSAPTTLPVQTELPEERSRTDAVGGGRGRVDNPPVVVDAPEIETVVARMARIPARQASSSDRERLRTLEESLDRVVFGQQEAVHLVAQAIKRSRAGLGLPDRPAGCFLFTGPTGVGKTELAKQLASQLGNEFLRST